MRYKEEVRELRLLPALVVGALLFSFVPTARAETASCEPILRRPSGASLFRNLQKKTVSVVLIGHGLNNPPSLMNEMARDLCLAGHIVVELELKGHDPTHPDHDIRHVEANDWLNDLERDMSEAQALSQRAKVPLDFVGYSLSALVFETYMNLHPAQFEIRRVVAVAPAIGVKGFAHLVRYLPLSNRAILPSRNRPDSRANSGTSLAAYRALFNLRDALLKTRFARFHAPHLVYLSRGDELVSEPNTRELVKKYGIQDWTIREIVKSKEGREHSHWHLTVSRASMGKEPYEKMIGEIIEFLSPKN